MAGKGTQRQVFDGLKARGLSSTAAVAAIANFRIESRLDPQAADGDAFGIAMWKGERKAALFTFAKTLGQDPNDINTQLDFFVNELNTTQTATRDALARAGSVREATRVLADQFFQATPADVARRVSTAPRIDEQVATPAGQGFADRRLGVQPASPTTPPPTGADRFSPEASVAAQRFRERSERRTRETFTNPPPAELDETGAQKVLRVATGVADRLLDIPTFGLGDEIEAGARSFFAGDENKTLGENFNLELDKARAKRRDFEERNPELSLSLDVSGSIATGVVAGPTVARGLANIGLKPAKTTLGRTAQVSGAGGAIGGLEGAGRSEGGPAHRVIGAATGAGIGVVAAPVFEVAIRKIVSVLAPLFRKGKALQNGRLTNEARTALEAEGIPIDEAERILAQAFSRRMARSADPRESARRSAADEFDVPLTEGQATGSFDDIAFEEAARGGSRGESAGMIARTFEDTQGAALRAARDDAVIPGAGTRAPQEEAERVTIALGNARETTKAGVTATYDAIPTGTKVKLEAFEHLPDVMEAAASRTTNVGLFPEASGAIAAFRKELAKASDASIALQEIDFRALESIRKIITRDRGRLISSAAKGDANAAGALNQLDAVIGAFDDWIDSSVVRSLTTTNPLEHEAAIEAVKAARLAHAAFRRTFSEAKGKQDVAGRLMDRLTNPKLYPDGGLTPQEAANFLYGMGEVGARGETVRLASKIKGVLGVDSEDFAALKRGIWSAVTGGNRPGNPLGAQAMSTKILDFTKGKGRALARMVFSPDEISKMNRFANVLRFTISPRRATNPSGTAAALARSVQNSAAAVTTALGIASGNIGVTFGMKLITGITKSVGRSGRASVSFDPAGQVKINPRFGQAATFVGGVSGGGLVSEVLAQ